MLAPFFDEWEGLGEALDKEASLSEGVASVRRHS